MALASAKSLLLVGMAVSLLASSTGAKAQERGNGVWALRPSGDEAPKGFERFDYVNPNAPKGGTLRRSADGTFDTLNPLLAKGEAARDISLVFDTLLKPSEEELSASYGLLAEGISYPEDISSATFRLRAEANFADGKPVTLKT